MGWFLKVKDGKGFRDVAALRDARQVVIGRATNVDLSFPDDFEMSSRHARVLVANGVCVVEDLQSTNGTFLNDERIDRGELGAGQVLRCGGTVFVVERESDAGAPSSASASPAVRTVASPVAGAAASGAAAAGATGAHDHKHAAGSGASNAASSGEGGIPEEALMLRGYVAGSAAEVIERFKLAAIVETKPLDGESTEAFARRCAKNSASNDCLHFLARALPKRLGIWWAIQCLRDVNAVAGPLDPQILDVAEKWVQAPSEKLRREVMKLAEAAETSTAASWIGIAIFWTHGSMAPPEAPVIPAAPELSGKALSGSVILAAVCEQPQKAPEKRERFAQRAMQLAAGEGLPK